MTLTNLEALDVAPHSAIYCLFVQVVLAPQSRFRAKVCDNKKMNLRSEKVWLLLPSSLQFPLLSRLAGRLTGHFTLTRNVAVSLCEVTHAACSCLGISSGVSSSTSGGGQD